MLGGVVGQGGGALAPRVGAARIEAGEEHRAYGACALELSQQPSEEAGGGGRRRPRASHSGGRCRLANAEDEGRGVAVSYGALKGSDQRTQGGLRVGEAAVAPR